MLYNARPTLFGDTVANFANSVMLERIAYSQKLPLNAHAGFLYYNTLCMREANALTRLYVCAGSSEPSLISSKVNLYGNILRTSISYTLNRQT